MSIIEVLAKSIDIRLTATQKYLSEVDSGSISEDSKAEYQKSVQNWMHDFSSHKSKILHYFGQEKMLQFENSVHASLRNVSEIISRTNRYGKSNLSRSHLREFNNCSSTLSAARYKAYRFLADLNDMTSKEKTGRIRMYDNVSVGNIDMISRVYLIQRLFGMKS